MLRALVCALLITGMLGTTTRAEFVVIEAANNATVQLTGPRTGGNGKNFFNVQGSGNFASFGVADFNFGAPTTPYASVDGLTISLVQSNAAFSVTGPVNFYFAQDLAKSIEPADPAPVVFDPLAANEGVGTQFGSLISLGTGVYTVTANGSVDNYPAAALPQTTQDYILSQLNTTGQFRLLVTPGSAATAATWAGFSNNTYAGPTLSFSVTAVPEPSTSLLLSLALAPASLLRRRRSNA